LSLGLVGRNNQSAVAGNGGGLFQGNGKLKFVGTPKNKSSGPRGRPVCHLPLR
jgi:hypothetical protein